MPKIVRKIVALYLRKSRDEEHETKEATLARHERMLTEYCKRNNLYIKDIYREVVSGENLEDRPQAKLMLEAVSNGEYNGVVVVELERLSRGNQIDQVEILDTFKSSKTKIYTLNKIYDLSSDNEFDEEFFEFGLFMSRREYKTIKRRLIRGKKQAQKEGYFIGSALPYGFGKIRGDRGYVLTPNEETPVIQMIFDKFANQGYSLADLRHYLNNAGIKAQKGGAWCGSSLKSILKNKTYIGYIKYDYKKSRNNYYKGKHEPIIDIKTFEKAQIKLEAQATRTRYDTALKCPVASLIKCSCCGSTMQMMNGKYIRCLTYQCPTVMCRLDKLEQQIIDELTAELKNFNYFLDNYGYEIEKQNQSKQKELQILNDELLKKDKMLNRACEMLEMGIYTLEKYQSRLNILENEKKALQEQINALNNNDIDKVKQVKLAVPVLEQCVASYWTLEAKQKNDLLKSIISKIEYSKSKKWFDGADDMQLKIYLKI